MVKFRILLTLFLLCILFVANTVSQVVVVHRPPPRPLCASQFALVNYACTRIPPVLLPPPPPPSPPSPPPRPSPSPSTPAGEKKARRHRHRHSHRHRNPEPETTDQRNCCRWLQQVDPECVCDLLVHLPPFLARPNHDYTVVVDEVCRVTYTCAGRLVTP